MKLKILVFLISIHNLSFTMQEPSNQWKSFSHNDFRIEYPPLWTIDTSGTWGADLMLFAPKENDDDNFSENVNVLIQDLAGMGIDLEQYKVITDQQITTLATDGKILESTIVKTSDSEFYRITYTMTQGVFKLSITSLCFIHAEKAFLVTFTSEMDQYDQYKKIGEDILDSFILIK